MTRPQSVMVAAVAVFMTVTACDDRSVSGQRSAIGTVPDRLTNVEFANLVEALSEPGGFFDTDNLISNESSYLHVIDYLRQQRISGGAYIGVGPGQNFSYIAVIRPKIAFIIDIRRDNLLQHLLYKALFALSDNRLEFLCLLTGRSLPPDLQRWQDRTLSELVEYVDREPADADYVALTEGAITDLVRGFGIVLTESDLATIARFRRAFVSAGLGLRFHSYNRPPRGDYPTLRRLLLETDQAGNEANYLIDEEHFQFLQSLESRNLIVPVVGDLAGPHALKAVGDYIAQAGESVSAFYTSNVEFYLIRQGSFMRFVDNVENLPIDHRSVFIRSFFRRAYSRSLPRNARGYNSTQLTQGIAGFLTAYNGGSISTYWDLVSGNW
jgi:hypothetical protein